LYPWFTIHAQNPKPDTQPRNDQRISMTTDQNISMQLQAVEKQSKHIVTETLRLQRFVQPLTLEHTDSSEAARES